VVSQGRNQDGRVLQRLIVLAVLTIALRGAPGAQERPGNTQESVAEKEILEIETLKNSAMQNRDAAVLEQIYGDSLIFVNARGKVLTKQDRVREFDSGSVKYVSFRQGDYRIHIYGSTAVVTGAACSVVDYHGRINQVPRRFTSVYVKLDGRWRFVAHQATLVTDEETKNLPNCSN
jgi:ketosteroid isomerase-like protein